MHKILIIRFSSIGDLVLTSPVIRCLKKRFGNIEIHYLTKEAYRSVIESNPYIHQTYTIHRHVFEIISQLRGEKYDLIVDLQKNFRTVVLKFMLRRKSITYKKENFKKWLVVNFKWRNLKCSHIVDRYFDSLNALHVENDGLGLDYFIPPNDEINKKEYPSNYYAAVIGGGHFTKRFPAKKWIDLIRILDSKVLLLGGHSDIIQAKLIEDGHKGKVINLCGKLSLNQSASVVKFADHVIGNDTGLMHIAAAFNKPMVSLWGNTVPEFGMYPYLSIKNKGQLSIIQHLNLKCRPCSKIGFLKCPKKHFDCMNKIEINSIVNELSV